MSELLRRIAALFRRSRLDRDLADEMQFHLEMQAEENRENGMLPEDAQYAAQRTFGNTTLIRENGWDVWGWGALERLWQDIRYALRTLRKNPAFSTVAVVTLALGIGATTAMFSIIHTVLLRPLPYGSPDRIVRVFGTEPGFSTIPISTPNFLDIRARNRAFASIAVYESTSVNLTGVERPEVLRGTRVSDGFFDVLGVAPRLGRAFAPEEDQLGRNRVAILGDGLWQRRFGGDPSIVGRKLMLDGEPHIVVGVLPASFRTLSYMGPDVFLPLAPMMHENQRGGLHLWAVARMKPEVTLQQARQETESIGRQLQQEYPDKNKDVGLRLVALPDNVLGQVRTPLWVVFGAVGCVLLIACANAAHLLLARAAVRRKEMAVRVGLGAGRLRLVRQMLTETLVLAFAAAAPGLLLAQGIVVLIRHARGVNVPRLELIGIDWWVVGFTLGVALLTGVLFGLAPAFECSPRRLTEFLKSAGAATAGGGAGRLRGALVISELALSLMLLIAAGLLIRTFVELLKIDPGFRPENVLTMQYTLPNSKRGNGTQVRAFTGAVLDRVRTLPGVVSAGITSKLPLRGGMNSTIYVEGQTVTYTPGNAPPVEHSFISTGYFAAAGIPVLGGRSFTQAEVESSAPLVIVNQALVRRFLPGEKPIGKRIRRSGSDWMEIVGVVGDTRQWNLEAPAIPETYEPIAPPSGALVIRAAVDPTSLAEAVRREVAAVDKDQPLYGVATMDEILASGTFTKRFYMALMAGFAAISLLLAAVGIYGVISYSAAQRTHEIGIRMALGAARKDVLRLVLRQGAVLTGAGVALGIAGAWAATRSLTALLYRVKPHDPASFAAVSMVLIAVALIACYVPARHAARMDPMEALRHE